MVKAAMMRQSTAKECLGVFPAEVWERILLRLKNEDLLACRLVCRDLLCIVDDQLDDKVWKPYFAKNRCADALSLFLVQCKGTRFSCVEDLENFFAEMKEFEGNGRNPFLNRTIIMNCYTVGEYNLLCQRFPVLVEKYGDYVRHCLYFVHNEVDASIRNIPEIFKMKNLRSLTIYCADWDKPSIRSCLDNWKVEPFQEFPMKSFSVLNILGDRGYTVIKELFSGYGPQIRRLNCWGHNLMDDASREFGKDVTEALPNLEELKICDVSSTLLRSLSKAPWTLKRFAVRLSLSETNVNLGSLMKHLSKFSSTLESFHLQIAEKQLHNNIYAFNIQFPATTDLRVPYFFVSQGNISTLVDVAKKFKNVKHIQLVDYDERTGSGSLEEKRQARDKAMKAILEAMWNKLPAEVEIISVRFRVYSAEMKSKVSVVMKYFRSPKVLQ